MSSPLSPTSDCIESMIISGTSDIVPKAKDDTGARAEPEPDADGDADAEAEADAEAMDRAAPREEFDVARTPLRLFDSPLLIP